MKPNPLLVAVLALVVLGGFVYYTRENPPEPESATVPLIRVEADAIQRVTVAKATGEIVVVERTPDTPWAFGAGVTVPADDAVIDLMVSNLASLDAVRVVQEETTDWGHYGLDGGQLTVTMNTADALPKSIIFGDSTPTGTSVYVRLADDPRLFTTFSYARDNFDKTVFDWRYKRLVRVDEDSTTSLSVEVGTRKVEFAKDVLDWSFTNPTGLRANRRVVGDLMREIASAQMSSVIAEQDEGAVAEYSITTPYAVAEIIDDSGSHMLTIAKGGPSGYFAKTSDLPGGVYEVPSTFAESLDRDVVEFRERNLFDFGFGDLSHIKLRDGDNRATIEKQDTEWVLTTEGGRQVAAEKVQALIDSLRAVAAISFPADTADAQRRYGLAAPVIEIETAIAMEVLAPEKVLIGDLSAAQVYAARSGEGPTYEIEKAAAEQIRQAIHDVLAPAITEAVTEE
jgi:hypothetical protein